jgi:hypothetical protein
VTTTAEAREVSWRPSAGAVARARALRDARDNSVPEGHSERFDRADEDNCDTRWTGEILELLFAGEADRRGVPYDWLGGRGQPDFVINGVTIDCKAGSGKGQPRSDYNVEISQDGLSSPVDLHVFGHWTPEEQTMHLVGAMSHRKLVETGRFYKHGDRLPTGLRVKDHSGIVSATVEELASLEQLFRLLAKRGER